MVLWVFMGIFDDGLGVCKPVLQQWWKVGWDWWVSSRSQVTNVLFLAAQGVYSINLSKDQAGPNPWCVEEGGKYWWSAMGFAWMVCHWSVLQLYGEIHAWRWPGRSGCWISILAHCVDSFLEVWPVLGIHCYVGATWPYSESIVNEVADEMEQCREECGYVGFYVECNKQISNQWCWWHSNGYTFIWVGVYLSK